MGAIAWMAAALVAGLVLGCTPGVTGYDDASDVPIEGVPSGFRELGREYLPAKGDGVSARLVLFVGDVRHNRATLVLHQTLTATDALEDELQVSIAYTIFSSEVLDGIDCEKITVRPERTTTAVCEWRAVGLRPDTEYTAEAWSSARPFIGGIEPVAFRTTP